MSKSKFDFAGYVTKNDILCEDGVYIKQGAFLENDGATVPLVWQHDYNSPSNVLGHINLEHRADGVYGRGYLNNTEHANDMRELLKHGDVNAMSIGARRIQKQGPNVIHGEIYEVSLVLKGANPGARIDYVLEHSTYGADEETAIIHTGIQQSFETTESSDAGVDDDDTKQEGDILKMVEKMTDEELEEYLNSLSDEELEKLEAQLDELESEEESEEEPEEDSEEEPEEDSEEEHEEDSEEEHEEDSEEDDNKIKQSIETEGDDVLKQNVFEQTATQENTVLTHTAINELLHDAIDTKVDSLANYLMAATDTELTHGISNIDVLFPTPVTDGGIQSYNPADKNVEKIMGQFGRSPLPRVKNIFANLTEDEARARGYIKGNEKLDSITEVYFRQTTPGTIMRRESMDRDDLIDLKDAGIDGVQYIQAVQRAKFKEEIVRAAFIGDGRPATKGGKPNPDKISEKHIRPIINDDKLFTIPVTTTDFSTLVDDVTLALPAYQGSGAPSLFINPFDLAKLKTLKDKNGRPLYTDGGNGAVTDNAIAAYFGASEVVPYFPLPQGTMILGNLRDYQFGQSKNGEIANFDFFDIDLNQYRYLIEARLSGAINKPKSFLAITVQNPDTKNEDLVKFTTDALSSEADGTINSDPDEKPGKYYGKRRSEVDAAATPGS